MEKNAISVAVQCGKELAEYPEHIHHFFLSFGSALFNRGNIDQRIEFLYTNPEVPLKFEDSFKDSISVGFKDGVPWISDISGDFRHISILVLKDLEDGDVYSVRMFSETGKPYGYLRKWRDVREPSFKNVVGETDLIDQDSPFSSAKNKSLFKHQCEQSNIFWNFRKNYEGKIEIELPSEGFEDIIYTRTIFNLIIWSTNILGFNQKASQ